MHTFDTIIIGSGFAGAVSARFLAEEANEKVLLADRRSHIGGNAYDYYDEMGILVHKYGPHIFHTNNKEVFEFLSRFTDWNGYSHEVVANIFGKELPVPFNLNSLNLAFEKEEAEKLKEKLISSYGEGNRVTVTELLSTKDDDLKKLGQYVFENVYRYYTKKQWGTDPENIDAAALARVPVTIGYDNRYFNDTYQGLPTDGYTKLFENMLNHENITLLLDTDAKDILEFKDDKIFYKGEEFEGKVIFTGAVDELFDYKFGYLPYRTLRFEFESFDKDFYQSHGTINYTVSENFTRITEFKHMTLQKLPPKTTIVKEYPSEYTAKEGEIPFYAVANEESAALYEKYKKHAEKFKNLYLLGRLAEFKYYNMDAIAENALKLCRKFERERKQKLITFAIPSYNSESYMSHCIETLLTGGDEIEIIIINDGSTDNTGKVADEYAAKYPDIISVVHQENGGHGEGVNQGLRHAKGLYYKVVDSDDWVDEGALKKLIDTVRKLTEEDKLIDLFVCNYVYEHAADNSQYAVRYDNVFPTEKICTWNDTKKFGISQYLMMHSVIFRTKLLKEHLTPLPKHTFYVDNLFLYEPLPYVKSIYYLNIDLYRYFIGRNDQSINESVMIKRIDQQIKVTYLMIDCHDLNEVKKLSVPLYNFMLHELSLMMVITSVFTYVSDSEENLLKLKKIWQHIKEKDADLYNKLTLKNISGLTRLPGHFGRKSVVSVYKWAKDKYKFG